MAFKVFLDVNLILDLLLKRQGYEDSKVIFVQVERKEIVAFVSPTVVQICSYWLNKAYGPEKTKEIMVTLLSIVTTIDTPHEQILNALHSSMTDIEDAMLYYTALHHKLDFVISNDQLFQKASLPSLPVISPKDFIALVNRKI